MTTESGDKTVLGNFRKLIDEVSTESAYNPANAKLKLPALNAQHTAADGSVDGLAAALAPNKLAITEREAIFGGLRERVVRSRNFLKASGCFKASCRRGRAVCAQAKWRQEKAKNQSCSRGRHTSTQCRNTRDSFIIADEL